MGYWNSSSPNYTKESYEGKPILTNYLTATRAAARKRELFKRTIYFVLFCLTSVGVLDYLSSNLGEIKIHEDFSYPMAIHNFAQVVDDFRFKKPTLQPINTRYSKIKFFQTTLDKSNFSENQPHGLLIIVKSAIKNVKKREAIRQTWGSSGYLNHTQMSKNLPTKLVFISGIPKDFETKLKSHSQIYEDLFPFESQSDHDDIILGDFVDSYGNNTYKSMVALRWAVEEFTADFQYLLLVDDDMYVDLVNLITYFETLPSRTFIKQYEIPGTKFPFYRHSTIFNKNVTLTSGKEVLQNGLYMGQVYWNARPMRTSVIFRAKKSEWNVPMEEYPFNLFPPYAPGAAMVFSYEAVQKFYAASFFVKHFAIDDVYFGIIANKLGVIPVQNTQFHSGYPNKLEMDEDLFSEAIAIHGYQCSEQLVDLWINRKSKKLVQCR